MNLRKFFLTVGFSGLSPKAPGTVGSFVSLILGLFLLEFLHSSTLFLLSILITVVAIKQIDIYEKEVGLHDSSEIVIDELAGMWIALSICGINGDNILKKVLQTFHTGSIFKSATNKTIAITTIFIICFVFSLSSFIFFI